MSKDNPKIKMLKCHSEHPDCFAREEDKCGLLESYVINNLQRIGGGILCKSRPDGRRFGTKFDGRDCPLYKTIEQAGGSYWDLCLAYPVDPDPEDRK